MPLSPIRTLFVTMMVYPPIGGEFLRNWQNINLMTALGAVGVFSVFNRSSQRPQDSNVSVWHHYHIGDHTSPWMLLERGVQWFRQAGLTYYCPVWRGATQALAQTLQQFKPDLVIIEQVWLYPYLKIVQEYPCQIIFDNHNVEAPLYLATKAVGDGLRPWVRRQLPCASDQSD